MFGGEGAVGNGIFQMWDGPACSNVLDKCHDKK